ncbi:ead/Ea22-like family protein [Escherichia coli]|uniref:ead/Ea22-like family protein n=1 Tax=Escherichia coli TaxID=562 RepID=UPI002AB9F0C6|nr:ead/Ea22-like family protein [Escherichia coli]MDZ3907452.1 ead/Ea22-like family protein [Escherichia coli]
MSNIDKQALREAAEKATKGEWWSDVVETDGEYGEGEDRVSGYHSYAVYVGHESLLDMTNSTAACIHTEWDHDYQMAWDETAKRNAEFIAAANPATVLALLDELEAKDKQIDDLKATASHSNAGWKEAHEQEAHAEAAEKRNAKLQSENAYIRNRYKELDLLIGKNILVMQAAIIEWQATGDAKSGLAWIYNTLFGPGELPDESEKDAQAYFNRKYAPIDEKLMALHKWFWEQSEAERAAANIGVKGK